MYKTLLITIILFSQLSQAEPYRISGGKGNMAQVIASKVLQKAYARAGIKMQPVFLNLEESLQKTNAGENDGELARIAKITKLYPNLRQVPVSVVSVEAVAFSKNKSLKIDRWEDLQNHKVTIVKGAKFIEASMKEIPKAFSVNFSDAFNKLDKGQTEIVVVPKLAGWYMIYKNKYKDISMVSSSLKTMKLYHFLHKKNADLIPLLTPYLQKMADSGEIAYIRNAQIRNFSSD